MVHPFQHNRIYPIARDEAPKLLRSEGVFWQLVSPDDNRRECRVVSPNGEDKSPIGTAPTVKKTAMTTVVENVRDLGWAPKIGHVRVHQTVVHIQPPHPPPYSPPILRRQNPPHPPHPP